MGERGGVGWNTAFVTPTDFGSHSMLHQTLISSSSSFSFPSPTSLPSSPSNTTSASPFSFVPLCLLHPSTMTYAPHHSQVGEKEARMEVLRSSLRPAAAAAAEEEAAAAVAVVAPAAWGMERGGGFFGDGFSVEELLDLGEFAEPEKEAEQLDAAAAMAEVEEEKLSPDSSPSSNSNASSAVSFELLALPPPPPEIDLPAHDAEELEWVSRIMDDSLSELPPPVQPVEPYRPPAQAASAKRSPTICALSTEALVPVKAKRSKRSRSAAWSLSGPPPFSDSSSSSSTTTTTTTTSSCSSSASFSPLLLYDSSPFLPSAAGSADPAAFLLDDHPLLPPPPKKPKHQKSKHKPKKRGRKPKQHQTPTAVAAATATGSASAATGGERRCSHCGVQKTPQWRAGPEGAKTLCNACGVRYKSGRLLPEYRPACSPTFVSSVHSNSHRKVLEMRRKKEAALLPVTAPAVTSF